ncbi:MAG: GerAB/ArcD/ProY family transporter [Neobacillus sp.]
MKEKLSPFQTAVLVYMTQSGVTLFSLPRLTAEAFGTNGWISMIIAYMVVNVNLVLIWLVFKKGKGKSMLELMSHISKWVVMPVLLFFAGVWMLLGIMVLVKFSMMLKLLFYPNVSIVFLNIMGIILCYPLLKNGLYHISKSTVVLFFFTVWTVFLLVFHLPDFSYVRLTPFIFQGEKDLLRGGMQVFTSLLGYELTLLYLHNVEKKPLKAIIAGNTITSMIYLGVCFVSYGFFSFGQLLKDMYPVVTLLGYITFPVLERVENFIFTIFGLKVLITTVMYVWAAKEIFMNQFNKIDSKHITKAIVIMSVLFSLIPRVLEDVDQWLEYLTYLATGIAIFSPVLLLVIIYLSRFSRRKKANG